MIIRKSVAINSQITFGHLWKYWLKPLPSTQHFKDLQVAARLTFSCLSNIPGHLVNDEMTKSWAKTKGNGSVNHYTVGLLWIIKG